MIVDNYPISDGTMIVKISGEISGIKSIDAIHEKLNSAMDSDRVYLDLSEVDFTGSVFINILINFSKKHKERLGKFYILNPSSVATDILDIMNLDKVLNIIHSSRDN